MVGADVADADAVDAVIAGSDAVLSALGMSYSRKPITVYSQGATNIIAAMHRHGVKRLVVVSSAPLDPAYRASDSLFFTRVLEPLSMRRPGRTTYEDMRRMESRVRASDLDWTIIRSCWLFDAAAVTDYGLAEDSAGGMFTARADLAASLLAQLADDRFVGRAVGVTTTVGTPGIIRQIWREGITNRRRDRSLHARTVARRWCTNLADVAREIDDGSNCGSLRPGEAGPRVRLAQFFTRRHTARLTGHQPDRALGNRPSGSPTR